MADALYEVRDRAAWISLNRPSAMNALSPTMIRDLDEYLGRARTDEAVRAIVITGKGKAFCAGADLKAIRSKGSESEQFGLAGFLGQVAELLTVIDSFPKPVVAAVNGVALAGGLEILLCCDVVIAAEGAMIGDGHATYGLLPGGGASQRLPKKIGENAANLLMFTGELQTATWMKNHGLVNIVVPDDTLMSETSSVVERISGKSPLALTRLKTLIRHSESVNSHAQAMELESTMSQLHAGSFDMAEGLAAFEEKRIPHFLGR